MSKKRKHQRRDHCACVMGRKLRCPNCGHKLVGQWPRHLEAQLDNLHAVVCERDELRRLLESNPADPEG